MKQLAFVFMSQLCETQHNQSYTLHQTRYSHWIHQCQKHWLSHHPSYHKITTRILFWIVEMLSWERRRWSTSVCTFSLPTILMVYIQHSLIDASTPTHMPINISIRPVNTRSGRRKGTSRCTRPEEGTFRHSSDQTGIRWRFGSAPFVWCVNELSLMGLVAILWHHNLTQRISPFSCLFDPHTHDQLIHPS